MSNGLVYLRPMRMAYVRAIGPYETTVPAAWQKLVSWIEANGLSAPIGSGFGVARDNPLNVAPDACRYDACVELNPLFEERAIRELGALTLPGGPYVRLRKRGPFVAIHSDIVSIYDAFAAPSGLKLDDKRPVVTVFLQGPRNFGDDMLKTDICVPVMAQSSRPSADKRAA
ncbi:MAG: AraC family transcriptional regulator [Hyphomicrobium sp.]